jgi:hypothetical protein
VVTKKPSSFFRRRKKSTVDHAPPPLLLPHSNVHSLEHGGDEQSRVDQVKIDAPAPELSPTSSLRKVMKPYLADAFTPDPRGDKGFPVDDPNLDDADADVSSADIPLADEEPNEIVRDQTLSSLQSYYDDTPQQSNTRVARSKAVGAPGLRSYDQDSFLADSSGNETSAARSTVDKYRRRESSPNLAASASQTSSERRHLAPRDSDVAIKTSLKPVKSATFLSPASTTKEGFGPPPALASVPPMGTPGDEATERANTNGEAKPRDQRDWLDTGSSIEQPEQATKLISSNEDTTQSSSASLSTVSQYQTASNTPIVPTDECAVGFTKPPPVPSTAHVAAESSAGEAVAEATKPLAESTLPSDKEQAQKLYDAGAGEPTEDDLTAAWLGSPDRAGIRKEYMQLFDWSRMSILTALQSLCSRIALKGEAQQVDRVLDAFSSRWCECNPNHGFKATGRVSLNEIVLNCCLHRAN